MTRQKELLILLLVSFLASIMLGMMDYETKSLIHLLTSDPGNWMALLMYTGVFMLLGITLLGFFRGLRSLMR